MASQSSAASAPRSAQVLGALLSAHETLEKPEHSRESASVQLWSLKEAVLDLPRWWLLFLPWLWVVFQACRLQYHRYCVMPQNDSGCGIPFFRLAGTSGGRCPSSSGGGFYGKSSNSSSKKEGNEMTLDRFYPSFEFQRHWRVLQLMWAQERSLCDCTMTANLLTGLAAWLGTSSLALKVCSQATTLAEFQVSCVITELEQPRALCQTVAE